MGKLTPAFSTDVKKGKTKEVIAALKKDGVNIKEELSGDTALHIAVTYHQNGIVKALLKIASLDINAQNSKGQTAMHLALSNKNFKMFFLIIRRRAKEIKFSTKDIEGNGVIHYGAMKKMRSKDMLYLLKQIENCSGYDPAIFSAPNNEGNTPLHLSVMYGSVELANLLARLHPPNLNRKNTQEQNPIEIALANESVEVITNLWNLTPGHKISPDSLKKLISLNACNLIKQILALEGNQQQSSRSLSMKEKTNLSSRLLKKIGIEKKEVFSGALGKKAEECSSINPIYNLKGSDGLTAFHTAVKLGKIEVLEILLKQTDADLTTVDRAGNTPLHLAFIYWWGWNLPSCILMWLSDKNKNIPSDSNCNQNKYLFSTATYGREQIQTKIAKLKNYNGQDLLHLAFSREFDSDCELALSCIRTLISLGADLDSIDSDGNTVLHIISERGNLRIARFLRAAGASPHIANNAGQTAIKIAMQKVNLLLLSILTQDLIHHM